MIDGQFFDIPMSGKEIRTAWDEAEPIGDDEYGADLEPREDWRRFDTASWAHISKDEQEVYFRELEMLEEHPNFCVIGDEGDGCISHIFIRLGTEGDK